MGKKKDKKKNVLLITSEFHAELNALVARANANVVPWAVIDARNFSREMGTPPPVDENMQVYLDGWTIGYSVEEFIEGHKFRRLWVSGPTQVPPAVVVETFMKLAGFVNDVQNVKVWGGAKSEKPRRAIVNVMEPLSGDWEQLHHTTH